MLSWRKHELVLGLLAKRFQKLQIYRQKVSNGLKYLISYAGDQFSQRLNDIGYSFGSIVGCTQVWM